MSSSNAATATKEFFLASVSGAPQQPLHSFLCLAPVQSASYPPQPSVGAASPNVMKATPDTGVPTPPGDLVLGAEVSQAMKFRRSSSVSSDGVGPRRFLKLGPVFSGGQPGVGDYADDE
ncbi:hypothetical protein FGG08_002962 [Glutinoglossum americanum]|uniref:Uncharacterized protein n=1 Tax=Glutinoglossum americanum TaxID=1670608 RepID=A0A9P8IAM2_9PEZI|nr:hypothetical protein FGG08_002962 [Glutinoglossum americanum]